MKPETLQAELPRGGVLPSPCRSNANVRGKRVSTRKPTARPCTFCQTIFTPLKEDPKKPAKYCSDKCRAHAWRDGQKSDVRLDRIEVRLTAIEEKLGVKQGDR
jgi:hypothetical protein